MPRPDPPDPDSLENSGDSTDQQRRKDGPRQVALGLPGNPRHNDHAQDHRRQNDHGGLEADAKGQWKGRVLVRFVADVLVCRNQRSHLGDGYARRLPTR